MCSILNHTRGVLLPQNGTHVYDSFSKSVFWQNLIIIFNWILCFSYIISKDGYLLSTRLKFLASNKKVTQCRITHAVVNEWQCLQPALNLFIWDFRYRKRWKLFFTTKLLNFDMRSYLSCAKDDAPKTRLIIRINDSKNSYMVNAVNVVTAELPNLEKRRKCR